MRRGGLKSSKVRRFKVDPTPFKMFKAFNLTLRLIPPLAKLLRAPFSPDVVMKSDAYALNLRIKLVRVRAQSPCLRLPGNAHF